MQAATTTVRYGMSELDTGAEIIRRTVSTRTGIFIYEDTLVDVENYIQIF